MIRCVMTIVLLGAMTAVSGCSQRASEQVDSNEASDSSPAGEESSDPKYPAALTCFIGEIGSRSNCSMIIADPREKVTKFKATGTKMTCGHPPEVSEIGWKFIRHQDDKDVYAFTRLFPADANERKAASKTVPFDGNQVVVFQDEHHVVVLHSPEE